MGRLLVWGGVGAAIGVFASGKNSYDQTGEVMLFGALIGLACGLLVGWVIDKIQAGNSH